MIRIRHTACTWTGSILLWERLPIAHLTWVEESMAVDTKECPTCKSHITCASLEFESEMSSDAAVEEVLRLL